MGISLSGAHKMVTTALRELNEQIAENAEGLRRLELERLDEWLLRIAQEIKEGRVLGSIDRGLRIMDRRAKLLGLDAPHRMEFVRNEEDWQELETAAAAGEVWAIEELQRMSTGEMVLPRRLRPSWLLECTAEDADRMTRKELALAAQGKLTHTELEQIRERPEADEVEAESR